MLLGLIGFCFDLLEGGLLEGRKEGGRGKSEISELIHLDLNRRSRDWLNGILFGGLEATKSADKAFNIRLVGVVRGRLGVWGFFFRDRSGRNIILVFCRWSMVNMHFLVVF